MNPMSVEEAEAKKAFLSKLYFGISLATFCTVLYQVKQGRLLWLESEGLIPEDEVKLSPAFQYARMLGVENATIIRMRGTEILSAKEYNKETFDPSQHIVEENSIADPMKQFLSL